MYMIATFIGFVIAVLILPNTSNPLDNKAWWVF